MWQSTVIGNVGKDAELRQIQGGRVVCSFSVATKSARKDGATTWIRCSLWGMRGEKLAPMLTKGKKVAVTGSLATSEYQGKLQIDLDVNDVELLSRDVAPAAERDEEIPF